MLTDHALLWHRLHSVHQLDRAGGGPGGPITNREPRGHASTFVSSHPGRHHACTAFFIVKGTVALDNSRSLLHGQVRQEHQNTEST